MYKILHMQEGNDCSMNRNDMRSVVYLIIALICFYYLMDDFFGKKKVSGWVDNFIGGFGGIAAPMPKQTETATAGSTAADPATAKAKATAPDTGSIKIPQPEPDLGKTKIPQPEGNQHWQPKTKTGTTGWSLPDIFHGFNPFPLGAGAAGAAAIAGAAGLSQLPNILGRELGGAF